jgi:hypothetical protein
LTASKTIYGTKGFRMEREVPSFKEEVRRVKHSEISWRSVRSILMIASSMFLGNLKKKSDHELHHDHVQSNHRRHPTDVKKKNEAKMNDLVSFFRAINIRVEYSWGI